MLPSDTVNGITARCGPRDISTLFAPLIGYRRRVVSADAERYGLSSAGGSCSRTSRPAPAMAPLRSASISAFSSMIGPRAVLITMAVFFICANAAALIACSVSSLCGACHDACPVGIPLHDLLVRIRGAVSTPAHRRARIGAQLWAAAWRRPWAYRIGVAMTRGGLRLLGHGGWIRRLPGPAGRWTSQRDLPTLWPPTP